MSQFVGELDYRHGQGECTGVLLSNLGTPDAPTPRAVRRYLREFLWDPRVVELPRALWWLILNGVILNIRPRRSAKAYQSVWTDEGSPLRVISRRQSAALQMLLDQRLKGPVSVSLAMRYGRPSIGEGLERLRRASARRILVLPLYPQYAAPTTASTLDAVSDVLRTWRWVPELRFVNHYHDHPAYIDALGQRIEEHWQANGRSAFLLFSFHGVPQRYFLSGDPYHCHCHKTARLLAERLDLREDEWQLSFQSRFGREEWLKPYTDQTLQALPAKGIKRVDVFCPGFAADCLETLEEIGQENRRYFLAAGGEHYSYIPALNDTPAHIHALADLCLEHLAGWPEAADDWDAAHASEASERSRRLAQAMGARR